jgi:hydroxyethylthiazole kinase-like uncharacterized protein yjeF
MMKIENAALLTAAQMRQIERAAIESGHVTGLELMERAGVGVVEAVFEEWPELAQGAHRAVVLCGPGNNGGDGFVIAHWLAQAGWGVDVFTYGDMKRLPPDAATNYNRWSASHPSQCLSENFELGTIAFHAALDCAVLVVDALFGTGLTRDVPHIVSGIAQDLPEHVYETGSAGYVVSVDIPSGLCADSGRVLGAAIKADLTVTFHRAKLGHHLAQGSEHCGKVVIKDIGL